LAKGERSAVSKESNGEGRPTIPGQKRKGFHRPGGSTPGEGGKPQIPFGKKEEK